MSFDACPLNHLPQKPYNVCGDLRDQLVYPDGSAKAKAAISDDRLAELLGLVDLEYLLERAGTAGVNWEKELSLGETQRLAMARLFFHDPTYAILDECTSAVSNDMEERLYSMCAASGITVLTISHRQYPTTVQKLFLPCPSNYHSL
jgi:ATP-binding cassette subfamily D (ALD) protein 3